MATQCWSEKTVAVVTGAGKGIGLEIVKALASRGISVVLTLRDQVAAEKVAQDLISADPKLKVYAFPLNITLPESVEAFGKWIQNKFGGIDILVNNAGLLLDPVHHNLEEAKPVLEVNYYGTKRFIQEMLPLMRESDHGSRIVNLSTLGSRLDILGNEWKDKLSDVENLSEELIDDFVSAYLRDVEEGKQFGKGWPELYARTDYCVAKMALNAYTRLVARETAAQGRKIGINCTSPGHTSCVMSGHTGHSPSEGALTAVWLALEPPPPSSGGYFVDRKSVGFVEIPLLYHGKLIYDPEGIKKHLLDNANYTHHK
ncbi:hypothetical protein SELMODRAFT_271526 [Selaginella moellendorffii]|uniref:Uncharacterized protein n=1 Tax=Selaginella moellendorffii TaxID=88036 RepID=D8SFD9_SELML|nr:(+)-neomenthol dehydrogenase [Selaginella moellendorffii]EFJ16817.1 hypothetical protein SELMODRAFT_271526 [Selaginella moellendorffii]|eukprot:XP_002982149.1 (+)-neomenthol dehydrogenase [Selaginella moellendorffii]